MSAPTLTYMGQVYQLDPQKTLLENLEAQNVKVEYHCRDGHCGACRSIIISGEVNYDNFPMAYLKDKEVLLCCSKSAAQIELTSRS